MFHMIQMCIDIYIHMHVERSMMEPGSEGYPSNLNFLYEITG